MAQGPATYHEDLFELNPDFKKPEFRENIRNILAGNAPESAPFPHCTLADFFAKPEPLKKLRNELKRAKWTAKANDLYSFWRTGELDKFNAEKFPALTAFALFMKTHVRDLVMELTGEVLTEKISVAGSRYDQTDVLLPHDDRMEERKFAFILYLTPEWEESYGGDLNLFDSDDRIEPTTIAKRITPRSNNFLFFDIRPQSWHSVGEVTAPKVQRLSLNGWFHCEVANINRNPAPLPPLNKLSPHESSSLDDVQLWVNARWRNEADIEEIQKVFGKRSEISIKHFVPADTYTQALADLKKAKFNHMGPPNLMNVEQLDESALAPDSLLKKLFVMARSDALTLLITQWTGLHLFDMRSLVESASELSEASTPPMPESSPSGDEEPTSSKRARIDSGDGPAAKRARVDADNAPSTSAASDPSPSKDLPMEGTASSSSSPLKTTSKPKKLRVSPVPEPKDFENIRVVTFLNKYTKGSYTLADDRLAADRNANGYCFDLLIFFKDDPRWKQEAGGFCSYIAANDPEEVLRIWPRSNVAAFVFREPEVLNFTKYINSLAGDETFYVFQATYFGFNPESDSESSTGTDEETSADEAAEAEEDTDLEAGYVENTRNYSYHTGHSSSDEDEDGDLQNEPPPLVDREIVFSPPPSPVPDDRDSEEEEDEPEDEEEEENVEADDESAEEADPEPASPEPMDEVEGDNDLPAIPDADSDPDDGDASVSSESASSTGSINSAATDDLPPAPQVDSGSDSEDTVSSTDSEQPMINLMQNHNQLPAPLQPQVHHNNQDALAGSGLEPEVDDDDLDENDPPFN